jgi:uncharacterized protein YbjT (DUF2867 family)
MNVLVTGATGTVGAHVVRALQQRGVVPRAFVRDPEKAATTLGTDVELAVGDFSDPSSIERALRGVDAIFLSCPNVPDQVAYECAVIDAARSAGVARIVKLSGPGAAIDSPLTFGRWHGEIEQHLHDSGIPSVTLRPGPYMTNLLAFAEMIQHTGKVFAPAGSAEIVYVDPRDVAAAAAVTLAVPGHEGSTYVLTGPAAVTYEQIATDLSAATGKQIDYVDVPDDVARQGMLEAGMPALIADFIVGVFALFRTGAMSRTTRTVRTLTGREAGTFAQFARDHAAAFGAREDALAALRAG